VYYTKQPNVVSKARSRPCYCLVSALCRLCVGYCVGYCAGFALALCQLGVGFALALRRLLCRLCVGFVSAWCRLCVAFVSALCRLCVGYCVGPALSALRWLLCRLCVGFVSAKRQENQASGKPGRTNSTKSDFDVFNYLIRKNKARTRTALTADQSLFGEKHSSRVLTSVPTAPMSALCSY